ncbi:MAG TPA: hypothetical protein VMG12_36940, partial [Polyangiaceae bacterium]|nr:hypothetical protein [Polyangiaceae bacterium]
MLRSRLPERQKAEPPPPAGAAPHPNSALSPGPRSEKRVSAAPQSPRLPAADRFTPRAPQAPVPIANQVAQQTRRRADGDFETAERGDDTSTSRRDASTPDATLPAPVEARDADRDATPAARPAAPAASPRSSQSTKRDDKGASAKKKRDDKDKKGSADAEDGDEKDKDERGAANRGDEKAAPGAAKGAKSKAGARGADAKGKAEKGPAAGGAGKEGGARRTRGDDVAGLPPIVLPPPPPIPFPPRLGGISARAIPNRPALSDEQAKDILQRTGMRPEEHHDKVRVSLDEVARKALRLQAQIVREAEGAAFDTSFRLTARGIAAADSIGRAEKRVANAYASARGSVQGVAASALKTLAGRRTEAETKFNEKTLTMEQQVERTLRTSSPAIQALHQKMLAEATRVLQEAAKKYKEKLEPHVRAVRSSTALAVTEGSDAVAQARIETEKKAWTKCAQEKADDMQANVDANAAAITAQKEAYSIEILGLVNPAAVQQEEVATGEKDELGKARTVTRRRVATDYERAVNAINLGRNAALSSLSSGEEGALKELAAIRQRLKVDIDTCKKNLEASIISTAGAMAESYRSQMAGLNQSIDPTQFQEVRRTAPLIASAEKRLQKSFEQQQLDLRQTVKSTLAGTEESIDAELARAQALADNSASEARRTAGEQISGIVGARDGLIQALQAPMAAVDSKASPYRAQSTEKLGQRPKQVEASVKAMLAGTTAAFDELRDKEDLRMKEQASNLKQSFSGTLKEQSRIMISDLNDRGRRAMEAMDQIGTNEGGLFNALRGITQLQGKALEQIWTENIDSTESLRSWLADELS